MEVRKKWSFDTVDSKYTGRIRGKPESIINPQLIHAYMSTEDYCNTIAKTRIVCFSASKMNSILSTNYGLLGFAFWLLILSTT